ncbi:MAG: TraB/VirB10 family protein [Thermodesulfovibrionales bacterium]
MSEILSDEKKRKKTLIIAITGALIVLLGAAYFIQSSQQQYIPPPPKPKIDVTGKQDTAKESFIKQSTTQIQQQDKQIKEQDKELKELKDAVVVLQKGGMSGTGAPMQRYSSGTMPPVPPPSSQNPPPAPPGTPSNVPFAPNTGYMPAAQAGQPGQHAGQTTVRDKQMTNLIGFEAGKPSKTETKEATKAEPDSSQKQGTGKKPVSGTVSAGAFVRAVLMNGVDAPSGVKGKGSPYPVLLRVIDLAQLPNKFRADIRECFAIGEAYGELSSERANIRINTVSCNSKDGTVTEAQVSGYVVGEDGKLGVAGQVVTKQGAMLARTIAAGFLQGVSQAFSQSATVVNISPTGSTSTIDPNKTAQAGLGGGVSKAAEELSKFYIDMSKEMFPVVEVSAGRKVEIVFINKFSLSEVK